MFVLQRLLATVLLLTLVGLVGSGCSQKGPDKTPGKDSKKDHHGDGHKAPHGGMIVEWGASGKEEYHAEVLIDREQKRVTVYVLDEELETLAIDAKEIDLNVKSPFVKPFILKAKAQDKDPAGKSSRFEATDELFANPELFKGKVSGTIDGKRYDGPFAEKKMSK